MKYFLKFVVFTSFLAVVFSACGLRENPLGNAFGNPKDSDPLKIGTKPKLPSNKAELLVGKIHFADDRDKTFDLNPKTRFDSLAQSASNMQGASKRPLLGSPPSSPTGDYFSLSSPAGAILTVWALARGNWLWGYTLADSVGFGDARVWRFRFFKDNQVMLENAKTFTCANAYGTGVIHTSCDETNMSQRFELIPMTNEAFLLKNVGTGRCLHAPINDVFSDFHKVSGIYLVTCTGGNNLDQQWYIIPPPFLVKPLYNR